MRHWQILFCAVLSCATQPVEKQEAANKASESVKAASASQGAALQPVSAKAEGKKRRLYASALEASTFLHQKKNIIWDRYHPNYAMDGDPTSAWNEGAETSGAGEWIKIPITKQEGLSSLTLRMMNGYQKSESLFQSNTRAKTIQVKLLPGGQSQNSTLEDKMDWQEISIALTADSVEAIELTILDVYEGKKYKDLCLSEIEVYATSIGKEDPEAELLKQKELLAWVQGQKDALSMLKGEGVLPAYEVEVLDTFPGFSEEALAMKDITEPMSPVKLSSSKAASWPEGFSFPCNDLTGVSLYYDDSGDLETDFGEAPKTELYEVSEDAFSGPCFEDFSLFTSVQISAKEKKETSACDTEIWVPASYLSTGGILRKIEIRICSEYTEHHMIGRPGEGKYQKDKVEKEETQTLLYDEAGRLRQISSSKETMWFDWSKLSGQWVLSGGLRDTPPARLKASLSTGASLPVQPTSAATSLPTSAKAPTSQP